MGRHREHEELIKRILPPEAVVVAGAHDATPEPLYAEEADAVANALQTRQHEFALGRTFARVALRELGAECGAIPIAGNRAPVWPPAVVGTITHTTGLVAVSVAWAGQIAGLGIDAESRDRPIKDGLERLIRTPAERERPAPPDLPATDLLRLVFSAKESIHKCVAPMSGITLGFRDVELDVDFGASAFSARLVKSHNERLPAFERIVGRFVVSDQFIVTAATIFA